MRDIEREAYAHMMDCRARGMSPSEIIDACLQGPLPGATWGDAATLLRMAYFRLVAPVMPRRSPALGRRRADRVLEAA